MTGRDHKNDQEMLAATLLHICNHITRARYQNSNQLTPRKKISYLKPILGLKSLPLSKSKFKLKLNWNFSDISESFYVTLYLPFLSLGRKCWSTTLRLRSGQQSLPSPLQHSMPRFVEEYLSFRHYFKLFWLQLYAWEPSYCFLLLIITPLNRLDWVVDRSLISSHTIHRMSAIFSYQIIFSVMSYWIVLCWMELSIDLMISVIGICKHYILYACPILFLIRWK